MSEKRKVVLICAVRNEEQYLKRHLPAWQLFADHVIIADQHSEDNTCQVIKGFDNVTILDNADEDYHEGNRNKLLIETARSIAPGGVFVHLDADEILSATILSSPEWRTFCEEEPGTEGEFSWVMLWRSPFQYLRSERQAFAYIDDGRVLPAGSYIHTKRGSGQQRYPKRFLFHEIVTLHYSFANFAIAERKNNWYRAWFLVKRGASSYHYINRNYNWFYRIDESSVKPVLPEWLEGYRTRGIDVTSSVTKDLLWYDVEILRWFKQYGEKKFHLLDIWRGIDWEEKRCIALERGIEGIPTKPIQKPNKVILFYNELGTKKFSFKDCTNKVFRRIARSILP